MKTCLVVDDAAFDRKLMVTCASKFGLDVSEASGGEEALSLCRQSIPDCLLLDIEMKGMDGFGFLQELRKLEGGKTVPVIMCTSHEHPSFIGHAYIKGASGFIVKPVTPEKFEQELKKAGII